MPCAVDQVTVSKEDISIIDGDSTTGCPPLSELINIVLTVTDGLRMTRPLFINSWSIVLRPIWTTDV